MRKTASRFSMEFLDPLEKLGAASIEGSATIWLTIGRERLVDRREMVVQWIRRRRHNPG